MSQSTTEFKALNQAVAEAWTEYEARVQRMQDYARTHHVATRPTVAATIANAETLKRVDAAINRMVKLNPNTDWTSKSLAAALAELTGSEALPLSAKTIQNNYLPSLRDRSPHCVQEGREWLWYLNARKASRDAEGAAA